MNAEELLEKVNEIGITQIVEKDYDTDEIDLELVHSIGGHEGAGEYAERVFQHENLFIKITGYYSSYNGTEWEDCAIVEPKQKTITVYE